MQRIQHHSNDALEKWLCNTCRRRRQDLWVPVPRPRPRGGGGGQAAHPAVGPCGRQGRRRALEHACLQGRRGEDPAGPGEQPRGQPQCTAGQGRGPETAWQVCQATVGGKEGGCRSACSVKAESTLIAVQISMLAPIQLHMPMAQCTERSMDGCS